MNVKNEKKVLVLSFLGVITFIAVVVGATYAYFTAQGGGTGNINVNAQTATTDNLSFQVGEAISLTANQEDFYQGAENKSGSTFARATLTANNATNTATRNYYVYLDITSNNFEYTTVDEQAELLLKVTDPDGTEVTTLGSLERKTSGGKTGFDITTQTGLLTIANNYEITSTGTVTQDWQVEVIFANLDCDQNANTGKSFSANLIIQEEPMTTSLGNFVEYITQTLYTGTDGENDLYYHDADLANGAGDNSYRFSGAEPNNYVCFGATGADCQIMDGDYYLPDNDNNIYRIIGVFDNKVKLIKNTDFNFYNEYFWDEDNINTWNETTKPDIYTTLNNTYYNTLGSEWQNLITEETWHVSGTSYDNSRSIPKTVYDNEVGIYQTGYEEIMKIGLMYASDYGYGASPENWVTPLSTANYGTNNWLFLHQDEWLLSHFTDDSGSALYVDLPEGGNIHGINTDSDAAIRPVFYLESNVEISSGTGTHTNPFIIKLN